MRLDRSQASEDPKRSGVSVRVLGTVLRQVLPLLLLLPATLLGPVSAPADAAPQQKTVSATATVPANHWKGVRLQNLPEGAMLGIRIESRGLIRVALLDSAAFARLPAPTKELVGGTTSDTLALTAKLPTAGDWYVVLDNRGHPAPTEVALEITATAPSPPHDGGDGGSDLASALELFETAMRGTFIVDGLDVDLTGCAGRANLYAAKGRILLCREYVSDLAERYERDSVRVSAVLLYALMHEAAHVLLDDWGLPLKGNENVADEMATVMLMMFGQPERVEIAADYFDALPADATAASPADADRRHAAPAQRARNLRRWLADDDVVRRWQPWLVPHLQTAALRQLDRDPRPWTDVTLVRKELATRAP